LQAINVVNNKAFRAFALYGRRNVTDEDLPHRTKLTELIFNTYEEEHRKLLDDFKVSDIVKCNSIVLTLKHTQTALGRISFTSDCWSDPNLTSFLALTAHFMVRDSNGQLILRNHLLAF
jgi:hypothetical protein